MEKKKTNVKPIMQELEYGEIKIKLDDLLTAKGITTYDLNNKTNIRFQTIQALRENKSTRIDLNVLAKLCYALDCKVEDLIEYKEIKQK